MIDFNILKGKAMIEHTKKIIKITIRRPSNIISRIILDLSI